METNQSDSSTSATGLIIISKLYQEGKISDEDREKLKDMIFNEDAILLSLFSIYEDEEELKSAVQKYCQNNHLDMQRPSVIDATKVDATEIDMASSPGDNALDMIKRKRLNQLAAQEEKARKQQNDAAAATNGVLGISDCDLGNSPQMSKTSIMGKYGKVKMSPLGGVGSRQFQMNNNKGQQ
eukprot:403365290